MAERARILVAEDERHIGFFLRETLTEAGYSVVLVHNGNAAVERLRDDGPFDLLLLDIRMPGKDGVEVMRAAREIAPDTVIILLTGHATVESAVAALREGAHDYLMKPVATEELLRSLEAGLEKRERIRRQQALTADLERGLRQLRETMQGVPSASQAPAPPLEEEEAQLRVGGLAIDLAAHEVRLHGQLVHLTPIEFQILACLAQRAGTVLTHKEIVQAVWGYEADAWEARALLNPHLSHLRKKLHTDAEAPSLIVNVRGVGYKLEAA